MKQKVAGMDKHEKVKEKEEVRWFKKIHNYVIANFAVTEYNKNRKVWLSEDKPY